MTDERGNTPRPGAAGHGSLRDEVNKQSAFESPHQEAFLNVARTRSHLERDFYALFKARGLTEASYNVLRIVRGHEDRGSPIRSSAIRDEMVVRVPDVTRLVDRLESRGLVDRRRCPADKRVVFVQITARGRELLDRLQDAVGRTHIAQLEHMTRGELSELNRLLYLARNPGARPPQASGSETGR
ncbi:MAG: MarR family transcriptional regulator [Planctomycetota bacterium]